MQRERENGRYLLAEFLALNRHEISSRHLRYGLPQLPSFVGQGTDSCVFRVDSGGQAYALKLYLAHPNSRYPFDSCDFDQVSVYAQYTNLVAQYLMDNPEFVHSSLYGDLRYLANPIQEVILSRHLNCAVTVSKFIHGTSLCDLPINDDAEYRLSDDVYETHRAVCRDLGMKSMYTLGVNTKLVGQFVIVTDFGTSIREL